MTDLSLKHIDKIYDNNVQAVFDFNLEIRDREFIVSVGPSGCGKSTTLRMIAGLEDIFAGEFYIDDKLMNDVGPKGRDIAMVFQSHALHPHMNVYDNMVFGLKLKKTPKEEIGKRVREAARILETEDYLDRKPKVLSGGQRQRVTLGRAAVRNARVLLMDEPLSNLDAKLRARTRSEIIRSHECTNAITIYVIHDQTEVITMADCIVVMKAGYIQQIGTLKEIYSNPKNMFVVGLLGASVTNFLQGTHQGNASICNDQCAEMPDMFREATKPYGGKEVVMGIRPEDLRGEGIVADTYPTSYFMFDVEVSELLGHEFILHGRFGKQRLEAKVAARTETGPHEDIELAMDPSKVRFFDKETEETITQVFSSLTGCRHSTQTPFDVIVPLFSGTLYGEASVSCSIWQPDIVWYSGVWECIKNRKERCFLSSRKGNRCKTGIPSQISVFSQFFTRCGKQCGKVEDCFIGSIYRGILIERR